jgi:hypothetical protein
MDGLRGLGNSARPSISASPQQSSRPLTPLPSLMQDANRGPGLVSEMGSDALHTFAGHMVPGLGSSVVNLAANMAAPTPFGNAMSSGTTDMMALQQQQALQSQSQITGVSEESIMQGALISQSLGLTGMIATAGNKGVDAIVKAASGQ